MPRTGTSPPRERKDAFRFRPFLRTLPMAAVAVWSYKLRSLFVILGVALGISSLTIIIASIDGAQQKAREVVDWFGPDAAFVLGGDIENRPVGQRTLTLTWEDAERIRTSLPGAYIVVPMRAVRDLRLRYRENTIPLALAVGSTENYAQAWNWPLTEGRDISAADVAKASKVCLLGSDPASKLFPNENPLGKTVFINNLPAQVIGILAERGFSQGSTSINDRVILPLTTLTQRFGLDRKYFRALRVKFHEPELMDAHKENLESLLRHLHGLRPGEANDFSVLTANEILKFLSVLQGSLVAFLGITAAVAMAVSGFILANLIYLSIEERRREIGLRKAVGASSGLILVQFLGEAVLLTLVGSVLGLAIGVALGQLLTRLDIIPIVFSWKIFFMGAGSAAAIGILFGLRPARMAAKLDPIQSLRG